MFTPTVTAVCETAKIGLVKLFVLQYTRYPVALATGSQARLTVCAFAGHQRNKAANILEKSSQNVMRVDRLADHVEEQNDISVMPAPADDCNIESVAFIRYKEVRAASHGWFVASFDLPVVGLLDVVDGLVIGHFAVVRDAFAVAVIADGPGRVGHVTAQVIDRVNDRRAAA